MLETLLSIGELETKIFFQECQGEEVIDSLSQESTNQSIRKAASDLADKYFRGSLNDGISSDLFMQQSYH